VVQTEGSGGIMETSEQYRERAVNQERKIVHRTIVDMNDCLWKRLAFKTNIVFITAECKLYGKDT
jgi:hypothetical protein